MAKASDNQFPKLLLVEGTAPETPPAGVHGLFVDTADDKLKRVDSAGTVTTVEGGGGGGGGTSDLLAFHSYNPAAFTAPSTSSTSPVDVDATNLAITFTAPSSGKVLVELSAAGAGSSSSTNTMWCLRNGTTRMGAAALVKGGTEPGIRSVKIPISGLTPGTSYTLKWAHYTNSGTISLYVGGDGVGPNNQAGAACMEVRSLP